MDAPYGYVCRIGSLPAYHFPSSEEEVIPFLIQILRRILKTKLSMEGTYTLVGSFVNDSENTWVPEHQQSSPPPSIQTKNKSTNKVILYFFKVPSQCVALKI